VKSVHLYFGNVCAVACFSVLILKCSAQPSPNNPVATPTVAESQKASQQAQQQASGPLNDFVPCLFSSDQQFDMHAISRPTGTTGPIDLGTIYRVILTTQKALIEATTAALQAHMRTSASATSSPSTSSPPDPLEYAARVGQLYAQQMEMEAPQLVSAPPDVIMLKVSEAATNALLELSAIFRHFQGRQDFQI
jgi:hypothetical protein